MNKKLIFATALSVALSALLISAYRQSDVALFILRYALDQAPFIVTISLLISTGLTVRPFLRYLTPSQPSSNDTSGAPTIENRLHALNERIHSLEIAPTANGSIIELDDNFKSGLRKEFLASAASEVISKVEAQIQSTGERRAIDSVFERMNDRLRQEVVALSRRGNVNLLLGAFASFIGIGVLLVSFSTSATFVNIDAATVTSVMKEIASSSPSGNAASAAEGSNDAVWWRNFIAHYIPRAGLVLMIELFAFFFLRLYKDSLVGIKYFQNEITNVENRYLALLASMQLDDADSRKLTIERLAGTERNFLINKDQTTVDLERARLEQQGDLTLIEYVKQMVKRDGKAA